MVQRLAIVFERNRRGSLDTSARCNTWPGIMVRTGGLAGPSNGSSGVPSFDRRLSELGTGHVYMEGNMLWRKGFGDGDCGTGALGAG